MGKRQIGELQPSELVITILMSNIATLPIEDINIPMLMGIIPIFTLVCLDVFMSQLSMRSRRIRRFFSGTPKIIISNGAVDEEAMRKLRYTIDDLLESLREVQVFDIAEVQLAIVETTGKISVYQKKQHQPATAETLGIDIQSINPPKLIVADGEIIEHTLNYIGLDEQWLMKTLEKENCSIENVFILTCDENKQYHLVKKKN